MSYHCQNQALRKLVSKWVQSKIGCAKPLFWQTWVTQVLSICPSLSYYLALSCRSDQDLFWRANFSHTNAISSLLFTPVGAGSGLWKCLCALKLLALACSGFQNQEILQGPTGCCSCGRETPPLKLPFCYFLKPKKSFKEHRIYIHVTSLERRQTYASHFGKESVFLWCSRWNTQESKPAQGRSGHLALPLGLALAKGWALLTPRLLLNNRFSVFIADLGIVIPQRQNILKSLNSFFFSF